MSKLSSLKSMKLNSKFIQSILKKIALIYKIGTCNPKKHIKIEFTEFRNTAFKDRIAPLVGTSKLILK